MVVVVVVVQVSNSGYAGSVSGQHPMVDWDTQGDLSQPLSQPMSEPHRVEDPDLARSQMDENTQPLDQSQASVDQTPARTPDTPERFSNGYSPARSPINKHL